jgi:hypothetical protein
MPHSNWLHDFVPFIVWNCTKVIENPLSLHGTHQQVFLRQREATGRSTQVMAPPKGRRGVQFKFGFMLRLLIEQRGLV